MKRVVDAPPAGGIAPASSKREQLQQMMGQAKLMEIIDQAYENSHTCDNCAALADWWEQFGVQTAPPNIMQRGEKPAKR